MTMQRCLKGRKEGRAGKRQPLEADLFVACYGGDKM